MSDQPTVPTQILSAKFVVYNPALTNQGCKTTLVLRTDLMKEQPAPEKASAVTKLRRLRRELATWAKSGAKIVPRPVRRERMAICAACSYFSAAGNMGLGACLYPGCGCTRAKAWLATSVCPHKPPLWPPYVPSSAK